MLMLSINKGYYVMSTWLQNSLVLKQLYIHVMRQQ